MSLCKRPGSKNWYIRLEVNGREIIKTTGTTKKAEAQRHHDRYASKIREDAVAEELLEDIYKRKTKKRLPKIALAKLPSEWDAIKRPKPLSDGYRRNALYTLNRFVEVVQSKFPHAKTLDAITPEIAEAYMQIEEDRGVSGKTYNSTLSLLKSVFGRLARKAGLAHNPFLVADLTSKETETIHKAPFSPAELRAIVDACKDDDFIRPIIVTAICTAMRRGDCCMLKWEDVDLKAGFITVKTSKTGVSVQIPIFPMLFDELSALRGSDSEYVFPEQAKVYKRNPDSITQRVKKAFGRAGFRESADEGYPGVKEDLAPTKMTSQQIQVALAKLEKIQVPAKMTEAKKKRLIGVFRHYAKGKTLLQVSETTGLAKGTVSGLLNDAEGILKTPIIRGKTRKPASDTFLGETKVKRKNGIRAGSTRSFHSFRVTWITLALSAGVPIEIVRSVTGHTNVEIILKHYFNPQRETYRETLLKAMPSLFMNGRGTSPLQLESDSSSEYRHILEEIVKVATSSTAKSWAKDKNRIKKLARSMI